jgi:hypothetical protein
MLRCPHSGGLSPGPSPRRRKPRGGLSFILKLAQAFRRSKTRATPSTKPGGTGRYIIGATQEQKGACNEGGNYPCSNDSGVVLGDEPHRTSENVYVIAFQ